MRNLPAESLSLSDTIAARIGLVIVEFRAGTPPIMPLMRGIWAARTCGRQRTAVIDGVDQNIGRSQGIVSHSRF